MSSTKVSSNNSTSKTSSSKFLSKLQLGIASILTLLIFTLFFILFSPTLLYRFILSKLCTILSPYTHILSPQGHFFIPGANVKDGVWANVLLKFKVRGRLNLEIIKQSFTNKVLVAKDKTTDTLLYPEFQQYCEKWGGYFFWRQETDFKIDDHIICYNKQPNKGKFSGAELNEIGDEYLRGEFELNKSPWQILIVDDLGTREGNNEEPCYLVLFKFHHTLGDGYAITNALMKWCDEPPVALNPNKNSDPRQTVNPSNFLLQSISWIKFLFSCATEFVVMSQSASTVKPLKVWEHALCDLNPCKAKQEVMAWQSSQSPVSFGVSVNQIKSIAKQNSCSFTAILVEAFTGGLRTYLSTKLFEFPEYIMCSFPAPTPNHPDGLVNSASLVDLKLPIGNLDTADRLSKIEGNLQDRKNSMEPMIKHFILSLFGYLPSWIMNVFPKDQIPQACCAIVPGPLKPVKLNGGELFELNCTTLSSPNCVSVRILTYANEVQLMCLGDYRCFSTQEMTQLLGFIQEEFRALEKLSK